MKSHFQIGLRFRLLLPLLMTGVYVGLLLATLMVPREPWVLAPASESSIENNAACSGEDCTVTFSPTPEPRTGRIVQAAMLLCFPAIFLGAVLHLILALFHVPHLAGELSLLGASALFVPFVWYRIGNWLDEQLIKQIQPKAKSVWSIIARTCAWFIFTICVLGLMFERHYQNSYEQFIAMVAILWTGMYLAGTLWSDWRAKRIRR